MKLTYRGITYQANTDKIDTSTIEQIGTYRGVALQLVQRSAASPRTSEPLKYRGVTIH
jgi:Domain of unknown function (DUF4278)